MRLRDMEFEVFRAILRRESLKAEVPVMAPARWLVAKVNTRESSPSIGDDSRNDEHLLSIFRRTLASWAVIFGSSGEQQCALLIP